MSKFIEETKLIFILWKNENRPSILRFGRRESVLFIQFPWILIGVRTEVVDGVMGETVIVDSIPSKYRCLFLLGGSFKVLRIKFNKEGNGPPMVTPIFLDHVDTGKDHSGVTHQRLGLESFLCSYLICFVL